MTKIQPQQGMHYYRAIISYDGTAYAGWQVQAGQVTVQGVTEDILRKLTGNDVKIHGSGRTDSGVHARQQVISFGLPSAWQPADILRALNALLPDDIRIMQAARSGPNFHARRSALGKEYRYFIWNDEILPPYLRLYRAHVRRRLDVAAMRRAADCLVGRHDFAAFAANPARIVETTVRELYSLQVRQRGPEIVIIACGEGFLYKMVRSLAGMLIRVGAGELPPDAVAQILASRIRTARVPTAPARGLFLWRVYYSRMKPARDAAGAGRRS